MEQLTLNTPKVIEKIIENKILCKPTTHESPSWFFRGQSNIDWNLVPSIARYPNLLEWKELEDSYQATPNTLFDFIAWCQHYGKKTRFMDFTTDLHIALYFACNQHPEKDGIIYACQYTPRKSSWDDCTIISELTLLKEEITLSDFSKYLIKKYNDFYYKYKSTKELSMRIAAWIDHGFMILPDKLEYETMKNNNPRIYRQKGAFFVPGNKTKEPLTPQHRFKSMAGKNIILPEIATVPDTIKNHIYNFNIVIPCEAKVEFLEYLKQLGIHEKFVYGTF